MNVISICLEKVPVANELNCDIVVSKFELQSRHYDHFWTNTRGKRN